MDGLHVKPDGRDLDGTFGRGGHARGLLEALGPDGHLLLMDKDPEAIAHAREHFAGDTRVALYHGSFAEMAGWPEAQRGLDGVLFDLGVSSPQLDVAERDRELFLPAGATGHGAIYTENVHAIHILRMVILRVGTITDFLVLKLH
jgi:hypothetical protein